MTNTSMEIGAPGDVITIAELEGAINYFNRLSAARRGDHKQRGPQARGRLRYDGI